MNYRITYLRSMNGQPIGCLSISLKDSKTAQYQISVLNPLDKFNRKVARQLAIGRLVESPFTVQIPKNASRHDIMASVMKHIVSHKDLPSRARKAARFWITWTSNINQLTKTL